MSLIYKTDLGYKQQFNIDLYCKVLLEGIGNDKLTIQQLCNKLINDANIKLLNAQNNLNNQFDDNRYKHFNVMKSELSLKKMVVENIFVITNTCFKNGWISYINPLNSVNIESRIDVKHEKSPLYPISQTKYYKTSKPPLHPISQTQYYKTLKPPLHPISQTKHYKIPLNKIDCSERVLTSKEIDELMDGGTWFYPN